MLDEFVVEELEADLVTSLDGIDGYVAWLGALVAAEVVAVHELIGEGGVIAIAVLANIRIFATDRSAVHNEAVEDVVGLGEWRQQGEESEGLHDYNECSGRIGGEMN